VVEDLFEGLEAAVMHVGGGEGEVAEAWGGKLLAVCVGEAGMVELEVGEEGSSMTMEAVGPVELSAGIVFGEE